MERRRRARARGGRGRQREEETTDGEMRFGVGSNGGRTARRVFVRREGSIDVSIDRDAPSALRPTRLEAERDVHRADDEADDEPGEDRAEGQRVDVAVVRGLHGAAGRARRGVEMRFRRAPVALSTRDLRTTTTKVVVLYTYSRSASAAADTASASDGQADRTARLRSSF